MEVFESIMGFLNNISVLISIATFLFVISSWWRNRKDKDSITISIQQGEKITPLPITILRRQVTRSEVLGILRAFNKLDHFHIAYTKQKAFFDDIEELGREGKKKELIISIQSDDKFELAL